VEQANPAIDTSRGKERFHPVAYPGHARRQSIASRNCSTSYPRRPEGRHLVQPRRARGPVDPAAPRSRAVRSVRYLALRRPGPLHCGELRAQVHREQFPQSRSQALLPMRRRPRVRLPPPVLAQRPTEERKARSEIHRHRRRPCAPSRQALARHLHVRLGAVTPTYVAQPSPDEDRQLRHAP